MQDLATRLVGLDGLVVTDVQRTGEQLDLQVELLARAAGCPYCGGGEVRVKERPAVPVRDLPIAGQLTRLVWRKRRYRWRPRQRRAVVPGAPRGDRSGTAVLDNTTVRQIDSNGITLVARNGRLGTPVDGAATTTTPLDTAAGDDADVAVAPDGAPLITEAHGMWTVTPDGRLRRLLRATSRDVFDAPRLPDNALLVGGRRLSLSRAGHIQRLALNTDRRGLWSLIGALVLGAHETLPEDERWFAPWSSAPGIYRRTALPAPRHAPNAQRPRFSSTSS